MTAQILRPAFTRDDKLAAEISALLATPADDRAGAEREKRDRIAELRSRLSRAYAERHGWVIGQTAFHPAQLSRGSNQTTRAEAREGLGWATHPTVDHLTFMRWPGGWRLPAAIVSQPYRVDFEQVLAFCDRWNLQARVESSFPSWWCPGHGPGCTALLVFTRKPTGAEE